MIEPSHALKGNCFSSRTIRLIPCQNIVLAPYVTDITRKTRYEERADETHRFTSHLCNGCVAPLMLTALHLARVWHAGGSISARDELQCVADRECQSLSLRVVHEPKVHHQLLDGVPLRPIPLKPHKGVGVASCQSTLVVTRSKGFIYLQDTTA